MKKAPTCKELEIRVRELERETALRRQAEAALKENEKHYRALLGAIPDPVVVYDSAGNATYVNDAFVRVFGWERDELLGHRIDFVPPEEMEATLEAWKRTLEGKKVLFETRRLTKEGKTLEIQLRTAILQNRKGKHTTSIVIHRDVTQARQAKKDLEKAHQELEQRVKQRTSELSEVNQRLRKEIDERKRIEESLRQSKKRLDLAMEATSDALWDWDLITNKAYFNRCFYTMLGYQPNELPQSFDTWKNLIHPEDVNHTDSTLNRYVEKKIDAFEVEYRLKTKQDTWRWILARGKVVERDEKNIPVRMVGTHVDITERKLNEEALRISEAHLREENIRLRSTFKGSNHFCNIIGKSKAMQNIYETILKAASSSANVIIYGESGTGKELVAQTIHDLSGRGGKNFVTVNCGAIPDNLIESEFFGYRKGAFTGANTDKPGYLDSANGGTLFMDEVGELNLNMQVKLLRAIDGGGYMPIGSQEIKKPDFRIIAATNSDLKEGVRKGDFRDDFYYRIHIIPIYLPQLRERKKDIPLLIHHFLQTYAENKNIPPIPERIMTAMQKYDWPGNVRELQNKIHRYVTLKKVDFLDINQEGIEDPAAEAEATVFKDSRNLELRSVAKNFEKIYIERLLREHQWRRAKVASILGVNRRTLFRKIKQYGIN
ncbi:MAG: sigma 54-interacting transcriptional regulator [Thermodesulfobacteriota bacterium]|nr:sigma 54-interacting transcriptional regulator [Thermodesulfobacteriota bacterium]